MMLTSRFYVHVFSYEATLNNQLFTAILSAIYRGDGSMSTTAYPFSTTGLFHKFKAFKICC
jgi:hypothetical protein